MRTSLGLLALTTALGCGGGSLTELEGVYTVTTWTQSTQGCDAEGPSVLAVHDPLFYIKAENFFGEEFVNFVGCEDVAECQSKAGDDSTLHLGGFSFQSGSDSAGWTDRSAFGFATNGMCTGSLTVRSMTAPSDGALRIESRRTDAMPFAADAMGECPDAMVEAAAANQPCASLEVVTATQTADI